MINKIYKMYSKIIYLLMIKYIDIYTYLLRKLIRYLPDFIYIKTFYADTLKFDVIEYKCNFNQRFYNVRFITSKDRKDRMYNFTKYIKTRISDRNLIFHSSIQKNGVFIRDITEEMRSYFHYIDSESDSSKEFIYKLTNSYIWKYIKLNIKIDKSDEILISLNDLDMTDIIIR